MLLSVLIKYTSTLIWTINPELEGYMSPKMTCVEFAFSPCVGVGF